jgi:hypothetical protein
MSLVSFARIRPRRPTATSAAEQAGVPQPDGALPGSILPANFADSCLRTAVGIHPDPSPVVIESIIVMIELRNVCAKITLQNDRHDQFPRVQTP